MKDDYNLDEATAGMETNDDMRRFAELARAARRRREIPAPDVGKEWAAFSRKRFANGEKRRGRSVDRRTLRGIIIGAAAMFAIMLTYNHLFLHDETDATKGEITAMRYDKKPQTVTLQHNESKQTIDGRDSISFLQPAPAGIVADSNPNGETGEARPLAVKMQKLSTPRGMDFKVVLPDGSEVWLNAESTIEFPSAFTGTERMVSLKGEAFFKIARNEKQPFIVNTEKMAVRVLGTEFNLKSYTAETPHVSLISGKVEVLQGETGSVAARLRPGQDAWVDEQGSMHVREIDTYAVTQWIRGFFYFDDMPLVEILRELSRWYNCGVVFNNRSSMDYRLHFSASRNGNLSQTVENLNRLCKSKITIEGNNLVVN